MPERPLVSVVMPVYNGERFARLAVDSILQQTYRELELIVVNDASTDRTADLLDDCARRDPRVRIVTHATNQGITISRNDGCRVARGELIAVMDSDDISLPHRLAAQVQFLATHPEISAVGGRVQLISEDGTRGVLPPVHTQPGLVGWLLLFLNSVPHPTLMVRRSAIDIERVYDPAYPVSEDYDLMIRLSHHGRIGNLADALLLYRSWPGNISKTSALVEIGGQALSRRLAEIGQRVSPAQAEALLGLPIERYPTTGAQLSELGGIIAVLRDCYIQRFAPEPADARAIDADAAMRLWLLAALAARRAPSVVVPLVARACRIRPWSVGPFVAKVIQRTLKIEGRRT